MYISLHCIYYIIIIIIIIFIFSLSSFPLIIVLKQLNYTYYTSYTQLKNESVFFVGYSIMCQSVSKKKKVLIIITLEYGCWQNHHHCKDASTYSAESNYTIFWWWMTSLVSLSLYFCVLTISLSMSPFYIYHFPAFKTFSLLKCNQGLMLNMFYTKDKMIGAAVKLWSLLKSPAMY